MSDRPETFKVKYYFASGKEIDHSLPITAKTDHGISDREAVMGPKKPVKITITGAPNTDFVYKFAARKLTAMASHRIGVYLNGRKI